MSHYFHYASEKKKKKKSYKSISHYEHQWVFTHDSYAIFPLLSFVRKASVSDDKLCEDGNAKGLFDSKQAYNLAFAEESHPIFEGKMDMEA